MVAQEKIKSTVKEIQILHQSQMDELLHLLLKYRSVFNDRPGCHRLYVYDVDLIEDVIAKSKQYPIPYAKREALMKEINTLVLIELIVLT